ncbi:MAG: chromosome segregation protein SMC [Vicinamibacterales bacterium]
MRLERLEINGFKSFSDRSELAFDKGVTAIVGPNGCGKSNVADAITWVMGEQSAKSLRGDKMEDVIFSGSDARKPTASAEVRLRFSGVLKSLSGPAFEVAGAQPGDDADGAIGHEGGPVTYTRVQAEELIQSVAREVEVTRRLYRSGESEYLIDGHSCRLRDIHDLLMDTGLGAKAYAIIEQGKIGMILSSRPTDRRQLIEEAAGVTKYKARRRAAELKLDAAQLNLTRIDDIVFEVEKQRGTLKRQAAKARRYQKLRDEMRRLEKVLFARKYRQLAEVIESTRARLTDAREQESLASAHVAEVESDFGRLRIELAEAESQATAARETAHARELEINRLQQQIAFETEQIRSLTERQTSIGAEIENVDARREPARMAIAARAAAGADADRDRDQAFQSLTRAAEAYAAAHEDIERIETEVERARSEAYFSSTSLNTLRHSLEHAATARDRVLETLSNLQIESEDLRIEGERIATDREAAAEGLRRAHESLDDTRTAKAARESELASARIEHEWRARTVRSREHELAGLRGRLKSLQELQAARAEYGDAARTVLAQADGRVDPHGAVADYLDVEPGYERAVEAYLGDLLQHIVVERPEQAAHGFELVRDQQAGRCGFLVAQTGELLSDDRPTPAGAVTESAAAGFDTTSLVALSSVIRATGPYAAAILRAVGDGWIAENYGRAQLASLDSRVPVITAAGDVFRGPHIVSGGNPQEARGILETKREIRDLADRIAAEHEAVVRLGEETANFEGVIAQAQDAIVALNAEQHRQEKSIVALDAQVQRVSADSDRIGLKHDQLARERRRSEEERDAIERRQEDARASIAELERNHRDADERFNTALGRLQGGRESAQELSQRAADAKALHAGLVERATAIAAEVVRLEEAAVELEVRARSLADELGNIGGRLDDLRAAVVSGEERLDADVQVLEAIRAQVHASDDRVSALRIRTSEVEHAIRTARAAFEHVRTAVGELDIARVTAEGDLAHLAENCVSAVQTSLDDVLVEVESLERAGNLAPDASVLAAEEAEEAADGESMMVAPADGEVSVAEQQALSAEDAIVKLKGKIDRLGPVNMMAIEQYDELDTRHAFLTTQRKDLTDSIAQTAEAIQRIDETTRERFTEAFAVINRNFQEMFSTLFGGGRAGLTLLDENDPLESGIEIVAQPPGKRLQSVQLLSGGEKALTAISLMFGLFKYKPSPFCLLDEIDAPLDDANIGRFVQMLKSLQGQTQFIIITHSRKTMEIADRLYGVTMEEPGVSKLISVQLN